MKPERLTIRILFEEGLNLARDGEMERAARCFGHVLELDPNHELAIYNLGVAMFRSRTRDGTGYAMASVKLNPTSRLESRAGSRSTGESHENG